CWGSAQLSAEFQDHCSFPQHPECSEFVYDCPVSQRASRRVRAVLGACQLRARAPLGACQLKEHVRMGSQKWLSLAVLICGLASACSQYNTNLSIQTSSSTLSFVSPTTWPVGAQGFTIAANGTGFVNGAFILWNTTPLTTTFVSSVQLTAPVPASLLTAPGTVQVAIDIPGSAVSPTSNPNNGNVTTTTEVSNIVIFTVTPKPGTPPAITSLSASTTSQASTPYCSPNGFTLTVTGTNFTSDLVVNWNGSPRATTLLSATQLTASI